jgi:methylase of polypeptide subunit release factors
MDFLRRPTVEPPCDIGKPQQEFVRLEESERISGDVLDVGFGTGQNTLFLAGLGQRRLGDGSDTTGANGIARKKAKERGLAPTFLVCPLFLNERGEGTGIVREKNHN